MNHRCVCKPTPPPKVYKKLKEDTPFEKLWPKAEYLHRVIPKGTRCVQIHGGETQGKFWIDDLSWLQDRPNQPCGLLRHDATHYGITIDASLVE